MLGHWTWMNLNFNASRTLKSTLSVYCGSSSGIDNKKCGLCLNQGTIRVPYYTGGNAIWQAFRLPGWDPASINTRVVLSLACALQRQMFREQSNVKKEENYNNEMKLLRNDIYSNDTQAKDNSFRNTGCVSWRLVWNLSDSSSHRSLIIYCGAGDWKFPEAGQGWLILSCLSSMLYAQIFSVKRRFPHWLKCADC